MLKLSTLSGFHDLMLNYIIQELYISVINHNEKQKQQIVLPLVLSDCPSSYIDHRKKKKTNCVALPYVFIARYIVYTISTGNCINE